MYCDRSRYALNYRIGDETFIAFLPFFHIYGKVAIMLAGLISGAKIVILPKFEPKLFLDTLQNYAVSGSSDKSSASQYYSGGIRIIIIIFISFVSLLWSYLSIYSEILKCAHQTRRRS